MDRPVEGTITTSSENVDASPRPVIDVDYGFRGKIDVDASLLTTLLSELGMSDKDINRQHVSFEEFPLDDGRLSLGKTDEGKIRIFPNKFLRIGNKTLSKMAKNRGYLGDNQRDSMISFLLSETLIHETVHAVDWREHKAFIRISQVLRGIIPLVCAGAAIVKSPEEIGALGSLVVTGSAFLAGKWIGYRGSPAEIKAFNKTESLITIDPKWSKLVTFDHQKPNKF